MKWKDSFVGESNYVEEEIYGKTIKFWPVSVHVMFGLRKAAKPLVKAMATMFAQSKNNDQDATSRVVGESHETVVTAISPELATLRVTQLSEAIDEVVDALTDPANSKVVGNLIIDSCREIFDMPKKDRPSGLEVFNSMDGVALRGYLTGLFKANKEVLGPLAEAVQAKVMDGGAAVTQMLTEATGG